MVEALVAAAEAAALAVLPTVGRGRKTESDRAAVEAMRHALAHAPFDGVVVIGEGEMDEAPMLYIGERLGAGGEPVDIAVDPLEGTDLAANAQPGAVTAIAAAARGHLLHAPDMYMEKMVVGPLGRGLLEPGLPPAELVRRLAHRKGTPPSHVTVVVLDRERHRSLVAELRGAGASVRLIPAGDMMPAVATCLPEAGVDAVLGVGGAPEGVLAAAAVHALGGDFLGRLTPKDEQERERLEAMGAGEDVLALADLCRGPAVFVATAVTDAWGLPGARRGQGYGTVSTLLVDGRRGAVRRLTSHLPLAE